MSDVIWHDLECGGYRADLAVWLALAVEQGGPILDVGAGTGRVALALARAGHRVVALDRDATLLAELTRRSGALSVETVQADARDFDLGEQFPLCLVPMQTIQLLGGAVGRGAFLRCARRHLRPGGVLALAIAERFEEFQLLDGEPGPLPDMQELAGVVYCSQPTAVRRDGETFVLERRRETVDAAGRREVSHDAIALDTVTTRTLRGEARQAGLRVIGVRRIAPTLEHVGSEVLVLGA